MLTWLLYTVASALLFWGVFRLLNGPPDRRRPGEAALIIQIHADYETLRRMGAEAREREEIERIEQMYHGPHGRFGNGFEERAHERTR